MLPVPLCFLTSINCCDATVQNFHPSEVLVPQEPPYDLEMGSQLVFGHKKSLGGACTSSGKRLVEAVDVPFPQSSRGLKVEGLCLCSLSTH